jgi:hypothetical protein
MKALALLGILLGLQDDPDLESQFDRLTSLDPDVRATAHALFLQQVAPRRESLRQAGPAGTVALALLGETGTKKELAKLLSHERPAIVRGAAEGAGGVDPDGLAKDLSKLLEVEDLATAMAAARSLSRAKAPQIRAALQALADRPENPRRKVMACYALELAEPGPHLVSVLAQAESNVASAREAAWAALANLTHAPAALRKRVEPREREIAPEMRKYFEKDGVPEDLRALFGRFLQKCGAYGYADLVQMTTHASKEVSAWARKTVVDPALLKKSVLITLLLAKLMEYRDEKDATREPIPSLEALLEAQGVKGSGDSVKERVDSARAEWLKGRLPVLDRDIGRSIDEGVAWLKAKQLEAGAWKYCTCGSNPSDFYAPGATALALYTLLKCDLPLKDKAVQSGFEWLLKEPLPNHTYTVALEAMACGEAVELLQPAFRLEKNKAAKAELAASIERYAKRLRESSTWLVEAQTRANRGGFESGDWDYQKPAAKGMDNSNTQFAVLGLRAAQNAGVPAPEAAWAKSLNHWAADQVKDGGWPYRRDPADANQGGSRSMSAAGMYCTLVAKATLKRKAPETLVGDDSIKKVLGLLTKHYPVPEPRRDRAGGHVGSVYYDLYSLERAMMVSKTEKLAGNDWYHDGSMFIVLNQEAGGEWIDTTDTCFALLFLKRAYVPVATGDSK